MNKGWRNPHAGNPSIHATEYPGEREGVNCWAWRSLSCCAASRIKSTLSLQLGDRRTLLRRTVKISIYFGLALIIAKGNYRICHFYMLKVDVNSHRPIFLATGQEREARSIARL